MKKDVFNQYVDRVLELFSITKEELFSKLKQRHIVDARQLLYYLCYNRSIPLVEIKRFMLDNGYDIHNNSVINGISVVDKKLEEDRDYKTIIRDIEKSVYI